jgi:hypothetical protein
MIYILSYLTLGLMAAYISTYNYRHVSFLDVIICLVTGPIAFLSEVTKE